MNRITFATTAIGRDPTRVVMLFDSLRTFGGESADSPCIMLVPVKREPLAKETRERLNELDVHQVPFDIDEEAARFPLAPLAYAAARAEQEVRGGTEILVWMNEDTLIIRPPSAFSIQEGTKLAYRPVHHTRIGSIYDTPPDGFWSLIYQHCGITETQAFPMETGIKDNTIRAYFNAGLLVVRPEQHLLETWLEYFKKSYRHPDFQQLFQDDFVYMVFMHQAVLSGVILKMFGRDELQELPGIINYPLNLHLECPPEHQPRLLNDVVTCRYESIEDLRNALKVIPVEEPINGWLNERLVATEDG
jgi:hypothetical protein